MFRTKIGENNPGINCSKSLSNAAQSTMSCTLLVLCLGPSSWSSHLLFSRAVGSLVLYLVICNLVGGQSPKAALLDVDFLYVSYS